MPWRRSFGNLQRGASGTRSSGATLEATCRNGSRSSAWADGLQFGRLGEFDRGFDSRGLHQPSRLERTIMGDPKKRVDERRDPVVGVYLGDVDRSLIRQNLKLSVEERFLQLMELQRFADELRQSGKQALPR